MDDIRFDRFVQSLAATGSRRRLLAGVAAGVLGLAGLDRAGARTCSAPGSVCREHATCCSGVCGPKDRSGRRRCQCQSPADCRQPDQCHAATCIDGACGEVILTGQTCDDRNVCTTGTVCQANGACGGGSPIPCTSQDQCHTAVCDPVRGCVQTPLTGPTCDDGDACTQTATCQNGVCVGSDPVVCAEGYACDDGRCFLAYPNCSSGVCFGNYGHVFQSSNLDFCIASTGTHISDACRQTSDCPAGEWCMSWSGRGTCMTGCAG